RSQDNRLDPHRLKGRNHFEPSARGEVAGKESAVANYHTHCHLVRHNAPEFTLGTARSPKFYLHRRSSTAIRPGPARTEPYRIRQVSSSRHPTTRSDEAIRATAAAPRWAADG